jgi:hypothetical protein
MILNDVTMRNYGRFQALVSQYDDAEYIPLVRAGAMVRAAREAGIAEALEAPLDAGDPLELAPTQANREALMTAAVAIADHINAATADVSGE